MDTSNILFIVGGAFVGLDKVVENRVSSKALGIAADIKTKGEEIDEGASTLKKLEPNDLAQYGLIPEFIGRLPVVAVLEPLSESALIDILVRPKNALVKQYQKLFSYEDVELTFTDDALNAVAKEAIRRNTGARGLRGVIENAMLEIMFEIPSKNNVKECIITDQVILAGEKPELIYGAKKESTKARGAKKGRNKAETESEIA